jgi:HlyD family secretion protein
MTNAQTRQFKTMKTTVPNAWKVACFCGILGAVGCRGALLPRTELPALKSRLVSVDVALPERSSAPRTTTQPATVHAWSEARIFANASGYVTALNVDIGTSVKQGDALAVLAMPELESRRKAKLAQVAQREADERRSAAQMLVAKANESSFEAKLNQFQAEVAGSQANLVAAQTELNRVGDLVKQRAVADRLLDEATQKYDSAVAAKKSAEAGVIAAEAELRLAKAQTASAHADLEVSQAQTNVSRSELDELNELLKYAKLLAPFDGIVTQRQVDLGDLVGKSTAGSSDERAALFVVTDMSKVRVRVAVPERDAPLVDVEDAATITLQAMPGEVFQGTVSRMANVLDRNTRTMLVEIDLPNPNGRLLPGMFGQATIALNPAGDTLTLPAAAVRFDEKGNGYVYVVKPSSEVDVVDVETGIDDGQFIEIISGLAGTERVVGPLLGRLQAGQKVEIR